MPKASEIDYLSIRIGVNNRYKADKGYDVVAVFKDEYTNAEYLINLDTIGACRDWCRKNYKGVTVQKD